MDYSLPCSVHGISQARILEWVAISTSRESSWPRNQTWISCGSWVGRWILYPKWTFPFQNTEIWNSSGSFLFLYLPPPYPKRVSRIWHYLVLVPNLSIALVMPSSHLILWWPLLPLPSIFPFIRDFSNELAVGIRWPKYWSFSFSISPSKSIQDWFPWKDLSNIDTYLTKNVFFPTWKSSFNKLNRYYMEEAILVALLFCNMWK